MEVPILKQGNVLIATFQAALSDADLNQLRSALVQQDKAQAKILSGARWCTTRAPVVRKGRPPVGHPALAERGRAAKTKGAETGGRPQ